MHFSFATFQLITETENCTTFYMFDGRASPDHVSLLICDTWISSRMSVIHTCHHGHCCHLKHLSLLHDIKVSTTRTSSLSLIHYHPLFIFYNDKWSKPRTCPELFFDTSYPSIYCYFMERQSVLDHWKSQCTT